jgi:hypothetical protein
MLTAETLLVGRTMFGTAAMVEIWTAQPAGKSLDDVPDRLPRNSEDLHPLRVAAIGDADSARGRGEVMSAAIELTDPAGLLRRATSTMRWGPDARHPRALRLRSCCPCTGRAEDANVAATSAVQPRGIDRPGTENGPDRQIRLPRQHLARIRGATVRVRGAYSNACSPGCSGQCPRCTEGERRSEAVGDRWVSVKSGTLRLICGICQPE